MEEIGGRNKFIYKITPYKFSFVTKLFQSFPLCLTKQSSFANLSYLTWNALQNVSLSTLVSAKETATIFMPSAKYLANLILGFIFN